MRCNSDSNCAGAHSRAVGVVDRERARHPQRRDRLVAAEAAGTVTVQLRNEVVQAQAILDQEAACPGVGFARDGAVMAGARPFQHALFARIQHQRRPSVQRQQLDRMPEHRDARLRVLPVDGEARAQRAHRAMQRSRPRAR
ncbi:hypothetical protein G6F31_017664 [Rhizopus arrhizus]|nr:hypothetical protein G6F31_017664 [Rhizopus arrhizus]